MIKPPSLAKLIKQAIENRLLDVHTALIGRVESYDASTQLVDVAPVLKKAIPKQNGIWTNETLPLLCDVPVLFPRAGEFFLSLPLTPGDLVQIIFNEVSLKEWIDDKAYDTLYNQRFTLQGAIAIPGVYPSNKRLYKSHKSNLVLGKDKGVQIHIDGDKIYLGSDKASEALAIASKVKQELDHIKAMFNSHSHMSSMGPIKPSDAMAATTDIATQKVMAL